MTTTVPISVVFGFVPKEEDKSHFGMMMYYKNRLIKVSLIYEHVFAILTFMFRAMFKLGRSL